MLIPLKKADIDHNGVDLVLVRYALSFAGLSASKSVESFMNMVAPLRTSHLLA